MMARTASRKAAGHNENVVSIDSFRHRPHNPTRDGKNLGMRA
jgi:hypothetical protein